MQDPAFKRLRLVGLEGCVGRGDLVGVAHLELVSGVVQLRPEDAMFEAMLRGWRAQQIARGLQEHTIAPRERLVRRFMTFSNDYPWQWGPGHVDEWTLSLTGEHHLAPSTIRNYQTELRLFSEYLTDARYVENIRPRFGCADHPALWVTERGGRLRPAEINARFVAYRDALDLPKETSPHSIRHSYVTHLTEDGVDRRFIQEAVGHRCDTSTAIYTHVSGDFMNTALRKALAPALDRQQAEDGGNRWRASSTTGGTCGRSWPPARCSRPPT